MLSSFINRRKVKKISLFDAALRRAPSSPSSEIHSDRESPRSRQLPPPPGDQAQAVTALRSSALNRQSSPKVHLDFTPSSSNDWFPQEILVPYDEDGHLPVQPIPQSGTLSAYDDVVVIGSERPPPKPRPSPALPPLPISGCPSPIEPECDATPPPLSRKPTPAPIKIPDHSLKVKVQHSVSTSHSALGETSELLPANTLRPVTARSSSVPSLNDDSSAISGTTLARALIANSFSLSNDNLGRNRYRSGGTVARQDSATLPGANETGVLISPYWKDRRISGGEIVHSPDSAVELRIPPVPPIPQSLSSALSNTHHLSGEVARKPPTRTQSLHIDHLSNRVSKKLEPPPSERSTAGPSNDPTPAPTEKPASSDNPRSPVPQSPPNQSTSHHNSSSPPRNSSPGPNATSDPAAVPIHRSQLLPSLNLSSPSAVTDGEGSSRPCPTPGENQNEPQRTGASSTTTRTERTIGSATSGEDIERVLTAYRSGSPLRSTFPFHLHQSTDSSTPSLSSCSGDLGSRRTDTSSPISFLQTPNSATKGCRGGLSVLDIRRIFPESNVPGQRQSGPSRSGLLPIGNDRPRSLQVPSSPFPRRSNESRRSTDNASLAASNSHSSGISSPDILDFMFIPSAPSIPSRPHPIKVIRQSLDSFEDTSDRSPITVEPLRQTFPETPQAFTPLLSANIGTPRVPPLPSSSVGVPVTPSSAAHIRGKPRRGAPNPPIERAATLYVRQVTSNSNRTLMIPITSVPGTPQSPGVRGVNNARKSSKFEAQQSQAAANLLTTSLSAPGDVSSSVTPAPRRNSDPTGRVLRDLETLAGRVELFGEASRSTPEVREAEPSKDTPPQRSTPAPQEKSYNDNFLDLSTTEGEGWVATPDPRDKDGDNVSAGSVSKFPVQGSTQPSGRVRRSSPKQRPQPLNLPIINSDGDPTADDGSGGSSGVHQEQGSPGPSSQTGANPNAGGVPIVSADTTTPVGTPARLSPNASIRSSKTPGVNTLSSLDTSHSHPSPNPSSHTTPNASATSLLPPPQRTPTESSSGLNYTPTSSTPQVDQCTSPPVPPPTLVSSSQYNRPNSLDLPSFASFLRQSYAELITTHPPPPYQTAILSEAISVNGENEPPAGSGSSLPSYICTPPNQQSGGQQPTQPAQLLRAQSQRNAANVPFVSESVVREHSESTTDIRMPRSRPLGPRKPSTSQGSGRVSCLRTDRSRQGSVSSVHPHVLRAGVGPGAPLGSRKLSTASSRGRTGPRFPTVPVKWRGRTLDAARWTFTSQELQDISSRAIRASAEAYYVRLLKLETLDTELPEELHRLELLTMDLKTRIRATAAARRELLDALAAHALGSETLDHHNLERVVEELGDITRSAEEEGDELYTVADQIAQLERLRDVHSSSALAVSLRKLNTSFLRQAAENQFLRERVAALEVERDIAWRQAENVAQEFDELSTKLERGISSVPSSTNSSRRTSRVSAVRKSSIRVSKSGLIQPIVGKPSPRTPKRSSSTSSSTQPSANIPPVPPISDKQDIAGGISQPPRHRPPFIQTANPPERLMPAAGLYSMTPTTETRAMAQAQRELCEMLGISSTGFNALKSRPQSMSRISHSNGRPLSGLVRRNSDTTPLILKGYNQQYRDYLLSPYDRELTLANLTMPDQIA